MTLEKIGVGSQGSRWGCRSEEEEEEQQQIAYYVKYFHSFLTILLYHTYAATENRTVMELISIGETINLTMFSVRLVLITNTTTTMKETTALNRFKTAQTRTVL